MTSFKPVRFVPDDGMRDDGLDLVLVTSGLATNILAIEVPFLAQILIHKFLQIFLGCQQMISLFAMDLL